ncbi:AbrB/MazE/SpoVT family DNA-binding domain-containing protein [Candidatus Peregrinibacteria bacterium]|nr:AbrB/MazE/SpoVT family DNA-binding domain-containing protein [Candidatus Peregrinibacteria bacterium]
MNNFDITSLSSKGQIVIPNSIRKELGIETGTKLIIFTEGSNLLIKPVTKPNLEKFKKLIKESREFVKKNKIKSSDLKRIIKEVRNENRT